MKLKPLILFLLVCLSLAGQNTFNWGDNNFKGGEKKRIYVEYQFDKKTIRDTANSSLDTLVAFLKKNDYLKIEVDYYGYVNPRSSSGIVQGRATSVADYLMAKGIDTARITAKGWNAALQHLQDTNKQSKLHTDIRITSTCYKHETFNYNDSLFYIGSKRRIDIRYGVEIPLITDESKLTLDTIILCMKKNPYLKIEFDSYTDPQGSYNHNMSLSRARSRSMANYLISKGIDSVRVIAKGYGFTQPLPGCSAHDIELMKTPQEKETAWQKDRRTEVVIIDKVSVTFARARPGGRCRGGGRDAQLHVSGTSGTAHPRRFQNESAREQYLGCDDTRRLALPPLDPA